jgi:MoaA/NifB/PqqE/SkfB family radical SAM enzyme
MSFLKSSFKLTKNIFSDKPFHLIFYITSTCNAKCEYCYYIDELNKKKSLELTDEEIDKIFSQIGFVPHLSISGGEPFLRRNIQSVLRNILSKTKPHVLSIPSNCSLPERIIETFDNLCGEFPETVFDLHISIDAYGEEHDKLRKIDGLFEKIVTTNKLARKLKSKHKNFTIKLVSVYSMYNYNNFLKLVDFIENEFVFDRYIIAWPHGTCSKESLEGLEFTRYKEFLLRAEKMNTSRENKKFETKIAIGIKNSKENTMRSRWNTKKNLGDYCNAGKKIVIIGETGKVFPCETFWHELGNLHDYDYNLSALIADKYPQFHENFIKKGCHCEWGCAQNIALVSNPSLWPKIAKEMIF